MNLLDVSIAAVCGFVAASAQIVGGLLTRLWIWDNLDGPAGQKSAVCAATAVFSSPAWTRTILMSLDRLPSLVLPASSPSPTPHSGLIQF
ncbi:uncharacterized protein BT62DRAFT_464997 [Guyanagaster necrorhizus]|uniref:Uncharacterized protein n=1 Tax=Guyanagaster necrorhizus TaxID=856835 RepID=A0A9P8ANE5_9AGAR|nr:uncharacterized protein BT62DRAFT_464997 [Guyanagaster necrorhizus MCA 3950]KAG7441815.1 hypothetical protein BT62DRAFT_464997 [Guyanagaster necrorhizus MCA 3950]